MVGEMRDAETTGICIEASLPGHLVFATLHTNSATESIIRLLDMGMDPFNFADALLGILAQRLAKRPCSKCAGGGGRGEGVWWGAGRASDCVRRDEKVDPGTRTSGRNGGSRAGRRHAH